MRLQGAQPAALCRMEHRHQHHRDEHIDDGRGDERFERQVVARVDLARGARVACGTGAMIRGIFVSI